ncbi:MAG: sigma-70 family RNA polymerase sigma factor [Oleispira sp.]
MTQSNRSNAQYLNQLVLQIAQHDERAYLDLFESCASRLKAYAIKCGSNPSDAEDLLQECMLTVWNKAPQFNPKAASAMTWMYTIIRNRRIDLLRKEKPHLIQSFDLWPDGEVEQTHSDQFASSQLDDDVESDLNANLVRILIESLPEEQRQIVYKVYFEGKSHSEIALDLGIPLGTIKSRLRLAMKKLDNLAKEQMTWLIIILLTNF